MGFIEAIKHVFANYANFNGRARRSEYWWFILFLVLLSLVVNIVVSNLAYLAFNIDNISIRNFIFFIIVLVISVYVLGMIIPNITVRVRRIHDIGKSGWYVLLTFIPFIGGIFLLIFTLTDSEPGDNMYGANPKGIKQTL